MIAGAFRKVATRFIRTSEQLQQRREAIEAVRQAIIQRADLAAGGAVKGVDGSSALEGGLGSIQSQTSGNLSFFSQDFNLKSGVERRLQSAAKWEQAINFAKIGYDVSLRFQDRTPQPQPQPQPAQARPFVGPPQ